MPQTISFDTFSYVKELKEAGMSEEQAAIQAKTLRRIIDEQLATKRDLDEMELCLKAESRNTIIKWVAGMLMAQAAVVAALVKLV